VRLSIVAMTTQHEEIEAHIRHFFSEHSISKAAWLPGPAARQWPNLYCLAIAPGPRCSGWVYISVGASEVATPKLEFIICTSYATESAIEILAMVTYYHATEHLGLNHMLPIGRPWLPGATCDQLFISMPYPFGPDLECISTTASTVQALWLLPITQAERTFAKQNGAESLECLFDDNAINPLEIKRASVV
jgi:hypothetical protein